MCTFVCFNGNGTSVAASTSIMMIFWVQWGGGCHLGATGGGPQVYTCDLVWMEWPQAGGMGENRLKIPTW